MFIDTGKIKTMTTLLQSAGSPVLWIRIRIYGSEYGSTPEVVNSSFSIPLKILNITVYITNVN